MRWNAARYAGDGESARAGPSPRAAPAIRCEVARAWATENRELLGLSEQSVADLELIYSVPIGAGRAVLFRQRFGDLPAGHDGLLSVGVRGDAVVFVSSSLARDGAPPGPATVSAADAVRPPPPMPDDRSARTQIGAPATEGDTQIFEVEPA